MASASPRASITAAITVRRVRSVSRAVCGETPLRPTRVEVEGHVVVVARVAGRVDQLIVLARAQGQAQALGPGIDHLRSADQDRLGQALVDHHLRRPEHPLLLAVGVDQPLRIAAGGAARRAYSANPGWLKPGGGSLLLIARRCS